MEVIVHEIAKDGLPDMVNLTGRVAFIFDGCIVSGWPLDDGERWEANSDVGRHGTFTGVTHWVEFLSPLWDLAETPPGSQPEARGVEGMVLVPRIDMLHAAETCDSWLAMHREYVHVADIERWEYPPGVEGLAESLRALLATPNPVRAEQPEVQGETVAGYIDRLGERIRRGMAEVRRFGVHGSFGTYMDDLAAEAIAYAANLTAPAAPGAAVGVDGCEWTLDDDDACAWRSACGEYWCFIDGTPEDNNCRFCHGCGKPVVAALAGKERA